MQGEIKSYMKGEKDKQMLKRENVKNIEEIYKIKDIDSKGVIITENSNICIYKIDPANILASDKETKIKIYNAYITCIRGLPDAFQVLISKEKVDFTNQIKEYTERLQKVHTSGLKQALEKYIEYLEEIAEINKLYKTNHYLVVKNLRETEYEDIINIFSNLEEFGLRIMRITAREEINKILRFAFAKEVV